MSHVINTHRHPDHANGNARTVEMTQAVVAAHPLLRPGLPLQDGQTADDRSLTLRCLYVPGHCEDHMALYEVRPRMLITGDLLFVGKVGGTSYRQGCPHRMASLQRLVSEVPDDATVWPGHDYGARPSSTMALEKSTNPFLRCRNEGEFLDSRRIGRRSRRQHGLR